MTDSHSCPPLVSIVLPTYNRAHLLEHAINNILRQTYQNIELIIVDDNSSDSTSTIIRSLRDKRLRYIRNSSNLKLPRSLNKGFSLTRGDYLTWSSDDNLFAENAIQRMVEILSAEVCDLVYADYYLFSDLNADGAPRDIQLNRFPNELQLEKGNHIGACFLYSRQLYREIGDYDPELFLVEDYDYFIRASKCFAMRHIPEPLYYFRRDDNTLYCSRYCEVKASDFLVRFKNDLLDDKQVIESMTALVLENIERINNPLIRLTYQMTRKTSYRLSQVHRRTVSNWIYKRLNKQIAPLLKLYRSGNATFGDTRDQIKTHLQQLATIEYKK